MSMVDFIFGLGNSWQNNHNFFWSFTLHLTVLISEWTFLRCQSYWTLTQYSSITVTAVLYFPFCLVCKCVSTVLLNFVAKAQTLKHGLQWRWRSSTFKASLLVDDIFSPLYVMDNISATTAVWQCKPKSKHFEAHKDRLYYGYCVK